MIRDRKMLTADALLHRRVCSKYNTGHTRVRPILEKSFVSASYVEIRRAD